MMLWHKAWLESRPRFLLGAAVIGAACAVAALFHDPIRAALATRTAPLDTDVAYIYRVVYQGFVRTAFMMLAFILGLGGLLREHVLLEGGVEGGVGDVGRVCRGLFVRHGRTSGRRGMPTAPIRERTTDSCGRRQL